MARKVYVGADDFTPRELPEGYVQLEFIESSGAQYLDTGYVPASEKLRVVADFAFVGSPSGKCAFGSQDGNGFSMTLYGPNETIVGTSGYILKCERPIDERFLFDATADNGTLSVSHNGVVVASGAYTGSILKTKSITIMHNNGGTDNQKCAMRVYGFLIYDNDILVRDYVPCINTAGNAGMYDVVNGEFCGNAGLSSFATGARLREDIARNVKKMYVGRETEFGNLPEGYTQVEHIESSGTQYIDTGFKPNNNTRVVIDAYCASTTSTWMYGAWDGANSNAFGLLLGTGFYYGANAGGAFSATVSALSVDHNKNAYSFNSNIGSLAASTFQCSCSMYLFRFNAGGTHSSGVFYGRIYSCKIYDNGTLVRNYVPCVNASGAVGLYDLLNDEFYENAGSGTFAVGAEVEADNEEKQYVEVARKIKKGFIGIGKIARPFWGEDTLPVGYGVITPLSVGREGSVAEKIGGYAVFAGGNAGSVKNPVATVDAYNESLVRSAVTSLSVARTGLASSRTKSHMIVAGGYKGNSEYSDVVEAYNESLIRSIASGLRGERYLLCGAETQDHALIAGGVAGTYFTDVDAYNSALTRLTLEPLGVGRCEICGGSVGGCAVFAGGYEGETAVDAYNESLIRTSIDPLPVGRAGIVSVNFLNCVLFGGGHDGAYESSVVDFYDESLVHRRAMDFSIARGYHAGTRLENFAIFFGGPISGGNTADVYNALLTRSVVDINADGNRTGMAAETVGDNALFAGGAVGSTSASNEVYAFTIL